MYAFLQALGLDGAKPLLLALLLPPLPLLLLALLGAACLRRRPVLGWSLVLTSSALQWAASSPAGADLLSRALLQPPAALAPGAPLVPRPGASGQTLILVLGGGRVEAPEYGGITLNALSLQRLRYGLTLSRHSGVALAFSGGRGPGMEEGQSEGELAARIAREEYGQRLAWVETRSRNTRENADFSVARLRGPRLRGDHVDEGDHGAARDQSGEALLRLILVSHDLHLPRALRHFARARDAAGLHFEIVPAAVGAPQGDAVLEWGDLLPSSAGIARSRYVLHEWLGLLLDA